MTRINCVPVEELHRMHLIAEYNELPRIFKLARRTSPGEAPKDYTLGKGHLLFFYDKLAYCNKRYRQIIAEMKRRGYKPRFEGMPQGVYARELFNDWKPTPNALRISGQRINERLVGMRARGLIK